jgi:hypothetical protein
MTDIPPITILRKDVAGLVAALQSARDYTTTAAVAYTVIQFRRHLLAIQAALKEVTEAVKAPPRVEEYEMARVALAKEHAVKDEKGQPRTSQSPQGVSYVLQDRAAFEAALATLRASYIDDLGPWEQRLTDLAAHLEQPLDEEEIKQRQIPRLKLSCFKPVMPPALVDQLFVLLQNDVPVPA